MQSYKKKILVAREMPTRMLQMKHLKVATQKNILIRKPESIAWIENVWVYHP